MGGVGVEVLVASWMAKMAGMGHMQNHVRVAECVARSLEDAHRGEDVPRYVAYFAPKAMWITSRGRLLVDRDALEEYLAGVMPSGLAGGSVDYVVSRSLAAGDGCVVMVVDQTYRTADGGVKPSGGRHRQTYVVEIAADDSWAVIAGQNTAVEEG